jgi:hypothetical protein
LVSLTCLFYAYISTRNLHRTVATRGRTLGPNWDKNLKSFPPCYSQSPSLTYPPPPQQKWFELVYTVNIVYGNLPTRQAGLRVGLVLLVCLLSGCDYINRYEHNPRKTVSCIPLVNWNIIGTGSIPGVNGLKIILDYVLWNELTCRRPSLNLHKRPKL